MPASRSAADSPGSAANQFRIRDLLVVTLAICVILGMGRAVGGGIGPGEALLLGLSFVSILLTAIFLQWRRVWFAFLVASFFASAFVPVDLLFRVGLGVLLFVHCFLAALPVVVVGPNMVRWRWAAAAFGVQAASAAFDAPDGGTRGQAAVLGNVFGTFLLASVLSWLLALAVLVVRYRSVTKLAKRDWDDVRRPGG